MNGLIYHRYASQCSLLLLSLQALPCSRICNARDAHAENPVAAAAAAAALLSCNDNMLQLTSTHAGAHSILLCAGHAVVVAEGLVSLVCAFVSRADKVVQ